MRSSPSPLKSIPEVIAHYRPKGIRARLLLALVALAIGPLLVLEILLRIQGDSSQPAISTGNLTAILILVTLTAVSILGSIAVSWIIRPIESMTATVEAVLAGDLSRRVEAASPDEVGSLANALNRLVGQIARNTEVFNQWNQDRADDLLRTNAALQVEIKDHEQAKAALAEERNLLRVLIDLLPDYIFMKDTEGRFILSNVAHARAVGQSTPDALIGKTAFDFWPHELASQFHADDLEVIQSGQALISVERVSIDPDGSKKQVLTTKLPLMDRQGKPMGLVGISRDITLRKQAEAALRESEARFQLVAQATNDAVWDWDVKTNKVWWNKAVQTLFGYTAEEVRTDPPWWIERLHPEDRDRVLAKLSAAMEGTAQSWSSEYRFRRADNSYADILDRGFIIRGEPGQSMRMLGSIMDITARKEAESKIRESEERLRALMQNSYDIIAIYEANDVIRYVSPAVERILGYKPDELIGHQAGSLIHPDDRLRLGLMERQPAETICLQVRYQHKDGSWRTIETMSRNLLDNPAVRGTVANGRDVTERIRAEETLKQAMDDLKRSNENLEQFAYVASHDLQEPLRMITSYLQLLEKRYKDVLDADTHEYIIRAVDGAARMKELIGDLLAYSRVTSRPPDFEPTPCETCLLQALLNLQISIQENAAQVTYDALPTVLADATQLAAVFQNLIGNAIKFHSDQPPQIHISAQQQDHEWRFSVRDNGIGIDSHYAEQIFTIFKRLHTKQAYPGSGIGLATCKKVVEYHKGRIWVESEPGQGSTFYFTIPVSEA